MYSCHLFLISFASVKSALFLSFIVIPYMKCFLDISNFLAKVFSLLHPIFLYFSALFISKGLLIFPCYSLELCLQLGISFPYSHACHFSSSASAICKVFSDNHLSFSHFLFFGMVLVTASLPGAGILHIE